MDLSKCPHYPTINNEEEEKKEEGGIGFEQSRAMLISSGTTTSMVGGTSEVSTNIKVTGMDARRNSSVEQKMWGIFPQFGKVYSFCMIVAGIS